MTRTSVLAVLGCALAACQGGPGPDPVQVKTIPGDPLKHDDTNLQVPAGAKATQHVQRGRNYLGFWAVPDSTTSALVEKQYHTDGREVYAGAAPGAATNFRQDYWFFVATKQLFVARYGNPAGTGEPFALESLAVASATEPDVRTPIEVAAVYNSWNLGRYFAHAEAHVIVEVAVGNPPTRRLYRAKVGEIERCLDGECKQMAQRAASQPVSERATRKPTSP